MEPQERPLHLYGAASTRPALPWSWVEEQLTAAGTYWAVAAGPGRPHPRPVWGVWHERRLHLSIGSPALRRALDEPRAVTVHLDSGTDVVLVEGTTRPVGPGGTAQPLIDAYNAKYDWDYRVAEYGDLLAVDPGKVLAWRSAGWAGRDGFSATGCWLFRRRDAGATT